jgi:ribose transport system permease protein
MLSQSLSRYSVLAAMAATIAVFCAARPSTFATQDNLEAILIQSSPLAVIAFGLTAVLVMNDFDLSFGAVVGLSGAVVVTLIAKSGVPWALAIVAGVGAGAAVGTMNGVLTAYLGSAAFIVTLAIGTAATGIEFLITDQKSIYSGIPEAYANIGQGTLLGINFQIVVAVVVFLAMYLLLQHSESGRRMYAVGGAPESARLAGVRVARLRLIGFMLAAALAACAGILLSAENGAYTPNAGTGMLLPAYAAAFLGTTVFGNGMFTALGTAVGVVFLGAVQNGLILLGLASAWVNIVQGGILVGALLAARMARR